MMNATEYLNQAFEAEEKLTVLVERRQRLLDIATGITPNMDGMPAAPSSGSKIESTAVQIADIDRKLMREILRLSEMVDDISRTIDQVPNQRQRKLLQLRYLRGHSWRQIQTEMGYSNGRSLYYVHRNAKKAVGEILKKRDPKNQRA